MKASNVCINRSILNSCSKSLLSQRGGIEILLLLVCIVGVVAFFSLALAFTSVLLEPEIHKETVNQWEIRKSERLKKEEKLRILKEELRNLSGRGGKKKAVQQEHQNKFDSRARTLRREQKDLNDQYHALLDKVYDIQKLIEHVPQRLDPGLREEKESELNRLVKHTKEMDKSITARNKEIGSIDNLNELNERLKKSKKTRIALESEVHDLKVKTQYRSTASHKRPLDIECRANDYVLYPGGNTFSIQDVEHGNYLQEKVAGHDLLAFWIRPEGIAAFRKAYAKAKEIDVAISFEPVQEGVAIETVLGSLTDEE